MPGLSAITLRFGAKNCQITTQDPAAFHARIDLQRVGAIDISRHSTTEAEFTRAEDLLRDGDDALMVVLLERGALGSRQQREEYQTFVASNAFVIDSAYCNSTLVANDSQFWILKIQRQKIAALLPA